MSKGLSSLLLILSLLTLSLGAQGSPIIYQDRNVEILGPGLQLQEIRRYLPDGWQDIFVLQAQLDEPCLSLDTLLSTKLTERQNLEVIAQGKGAVAAVNGDFFFMGTTGAPVGFTVAEGELIKGPSLAYPRPSLIFYGDRAKLQIARWQAYVQAGEGRYPIAGYNETILPPGGIVIYDEHWAQQSPGRNAVHTWLADLIVEVVVIDGVVVEIRENLPGRGFPPGGLILTGREEGARFLLSLAPGQSIDLQWKLTPALEEIKTAVSGYNLLVEKGRPTGNYPPSLGGIHPRTAVGLDATGRLLTMVVVDGRSPHRRGMTLDELAEFMVEIGVWQALNLDGGGSSSMVVRKAGQAEAQLLNAPPGGMRPIPNGLGFSYVGKTSPIRRLHVDTLYPQEELGDELRLIQGEPIVVPLNGRRTFRVTGLDRYHNPTPLPAEAVSWSVFPQSRGKFIAPGVFLGQESGPALIHVAYQNQGHQVNFVASVSISQPLERLTAQPQGLTLLPGAEERIQLKGWDAAGYPCLIEGADIQWEIPGKLGSIDGDSFRAQGRGRGTIIASFSGLQVDIPVEIGAGMVPLASPNWSARGHPQALVPAEVSYGPPPKEGLPAGIGLDYDFRQKAPTRAAYVRPEEPFFLPNEVLGIGLWVWGEEGNGHWLRAQVRDGVGRIHPIDLADRVQWSGWRYVQGQIPSSLPRPLHLESIYLVTIDGKASDKGQIFFRDLAALVPVEEKVKVLPFDAAPAEPQGWRFLLFGNSHLAVGTPSRARNHLQELAREEAQFAIVLGGLVAEPTGANFRSARRTLSLFPRYYPVPGSEGGQLWREHFGQGYGSFLHGDSRFILLDSSQGGLTASDPRQWSWLEEQLAASEEERVFLISFLPPFHPQGPSFADEREGALLHQMLVRHHERTRQEIWVISSLDAGFWWEKRSGINYVAGSTFADDYCLLFDVDEEVKFYLHPLK
ncbi:MAG: phosphodiester glycosidase family protein [Limnochordia bacterium]|jgi:hypothetical protein